MKIKQETLVLFLVWCIIVIISFKDALTGYPFFLSFRVRLLDDLLVLIMYLLLIKDLFANRLQKDGIFLLMFITIFFLYWILQNTVIEGDWVKNNVAFLIRDNLWYVPVFYYVKKYSQSEKFSRSLLAGLYFFIYSQVAAFVLAQAYHIITRGYILIDVDVNGTLGYHSSHVIAYALVLFLPLLLKYNNRLLLLAVSSIIITASARSLILFGILSTALVLLFSGRLRKLLMVMVLGGILALPLYNFFNAQKITWEPAKIWRHQYQPLNQSTIGAKRATFLIYSFNKILVSPDRLLFGYGVASYASRTAKNLRGSEYLQHLQDFPFDNSFIEGGSSLNYWLVEYGLIGSILLAVFFLIIFLGINDTAVKIVYLTCIFGLLAQKLMEYYPVAFFFWCLYGFYQGSFYDSSYNVKHAS
jgi:hypothetical protein